MHSLWYASHNDRCVTGQRKKMEQGKKREAEERRYATNPTCRTPFYSGETVRDIVIGMSDGLTVPFALAAGLSGAVSSSTIIITADLPR